ncbi:MAG: mannose-1-phosphate guanylyltransferase/mannose-6-phosphate isomerase, partial [Chloroflexi bacterium]|nr:mannose-1-phosphate guanylyltransferase/mannose-6-phosphate isomerase [Chloroflexota bacterium]
VLPLIGERSLLQETIGRLEGLPDVAAPIVVCNEEHRFLVAEHMRQIGIRPNAIALEPEGRNTAPALTLAALILTSGSSSGATADDGNVMLVMPADHVIKDVPGFQKALQTGAKLAAKGNLVTFGIVPTSPETGYGYIHKGSANDSAFRVAEFVEKPDLAAAERMLATEEYLWNSGLFMMQPSVWLRELERYRPDIARACEAAHAASNLDGDFYRPDADLFAACPSESIDYAVMERAGSAATADAFSCLVVPLDVGWSDLGAWSTLWEEGSKDASGNLIQGDVYAHPSMKDSLLISQHRLLAAVGLKDVIVVETADAVLVAHKNSVQDVKDLVAHLKAEHRPEQRNHRKVHRPWGTYETVDVGGRFQVKRLSVNPGAALSLQMHHHRAEHWVVVTGTVKVTRGDEEFLLTENQSTYVPVGVKHRLENPGTITTEIIEVQTGSYLEEDDIVRFQDRYNRLDSA